MYFKFFLQNWNDCTGLLFTSHVIALHAFPMLSLNGILSISPTIKIKKKCFLFFSFNILRIEGLNSDGQQFRQYQHKELLPLTLARWTQNYNVGNPGRGGVNRLIGSQPSSPRNWISKGNTYIKKWFYKSLPTFASDRKDILSQKTKYNTT